MTRLKLILISITFGNILSGQILDTDTINFYDKSRFEQKNELKENSKIDFIEFVEISGTLRKKDFYDSKQRIYKEQLWRDTLMKETVFEYFENNQVIKRFDLLNNRHLSTVLKVNIKYPALARENGIEGIIEVTLKYDENCIPTSYEILNRLNHGIDEEVEKNMELMIHLARKYQVSFDECKDKNNNFKINFKLE